MSQRRAAVFFEFSQGGVGGGDGQGVAVVGPAEGDAVHQLLHDLPAAGHRAEGQAAPDGFPEGTKIGCDSVKLLGAAQGDPEARDDLVEDEEGAMPGADLLNAAQVGLPRQQTAAVAQDRLHDDGGDPVAMLPEEAVHQVHSIPATDQQIIQRRQQLASCAGRGPGLLDSPDLFQRGVVAGQDRVHPAVVVAFELDHELAPGEGSGQPQGQLHGFASAGSEGHPFGARDEPLDSLGKTGLQFMLGAVMKGTLHLGPKRFQKGRVAMAQDQRAPAQAVVDVAVPVHVFQPAARAIPKEQGHRRLAPEGTADAAGEGPFGPNQELP